MIPGGGSLQLDHNVVHWRWEKKGGGSPGKYEEGDVRDAGEKTAGDKSS